jgi:hypothetical protein
MQLIGGARTGKKLACRFFTSADWFIELARNEFRGLEQGCQIFLGTIYQNGGEI